MLGSPVTWETGQHGEKKRNQRCSGLQNENDKCGVISHLGAVRSKTSTTMLCVIYTPLRCPLRTQHAPQQPGFFVWPMP